MPLKIDQHGPIGLTFSNGPIVDAEHLGDGHTWKGQTTQQAQEGVATDGQAQGTAEACACRPRQLQGDVHQPVREPLCPPSPEGSHER